MDNEKARASVLRRAAQRLSVLRAAFDASDGGQSNYMIDPFAIARHLALSEDDVFDAVNYLHEEGLLKKMTLDGSFCVTHEGRTEVEQTLTAPENGSDHFSPAAIQVFNNTTNNTTTTVHGNIGANVVGSGNSTNVTQTVSTVALSQVKDYLSALRKATDELSNADDRKEAEEIIVEWEEAAESGDKSLIRRLPRESKQLQKYFTANNATAAIALVGTVVDVITKLFQ